MPAGLQLIAAAAALGDQTFREIWDNPVDAVYDRL